MKKILFIVSLIIALLALSASASTYQPAMWIMDDLYFTQLPGGGYSHAGTLNFDIIGVSNNSIRAPFDCQVVDLFPTWDSANTVIVQSTQPVMYANGTIDYMSMAFGHDEYIGDRWVGQTFQQGDVIGQTGKYGPADGVHSHVTVIRGRYTDHPGWLQVFPSKNWTFHNAMYPTDAFFIYENTIVHNTMGLSFATYKPIQIKDLGDSFQAKIHLVEGNKAITATASGNIELATDADTAYQDWYFERTDRGSYIIYNFKDGQVMDLANGGTVNGTNISLCPRHAYDNPSLIYQKWYICENGNGYRLVPEASPTRSLDAEGASTADGTNIQLYGINDSIAQRIRIDAFGGEVLKGISCSESELTLKEGQYKQLSVSYNPLQAVPLNKRGVRWSSSDETVATVDSTGMVTAIGAGSCTITVTSTYNDVFSSSCAVTVDGGSRPDVPEITNLTVRGSSIHLSWSESALVDENDVRTYEVFVYPKGDIDNYVWSDWDVAATSCDITLSEHGEYVAYVRAVNQTEDVRSDFSSRAFTVLDDEWMYFDELPDELPEGEIQYLNHYNDREQDECPGEGWVLSDTKTTYVNGNVLYSEDPYPLQESDTLVPLGTFYYHYCDGSSSVEAFWTSKYCNHTRMDNYGQFDVVWSGPDETNPYYTVYRLRWNTGEWAGGLATCAYGSASPMSLYYMGYRYQERTAVTTNIWSKEADWSNAPDPNADSVSYRVRAISYANQLNIPAGTVRIEAESFMNDTLVQEVIVPEGCEYIGSRAFADCTDLKRAYIPADTVVEADAFAGCDQVKIIRTGA